MSTILSQSASEILLAILPGASDIDRTVLVMRTTVANEPVGFELRKESWDRGLGWYAQQSIQLNANQLSGLRAALGSHLPSSAGDKKTATQLSHRQSAFNPQLRIVRADSA